MPFKILDDLSIIGRKGDSASFTFEFEDNDISSYDFIFQVKKDITDTDQNAILRKCIKNPTGNSITIELLPEDTLSVTTVGSGYTTLCWGLKAYISDSYAQTLIPKDNTPAPRFSLLPAIAEEITDDD